MVTLFNKHSKNIFISLMPGLFSIFLTFFTIPIFLNYLSKEIYANYLIQHFLLSLGMILNLQIGKIASIKIQKMSLIKKKTLISTTIFFSITLSIIISLCVYIFLILFFKNNNLLEITSSFLIGLSMTIFYISLEFIIKGINQFKISSFSNFVFYSLSISLPAIFLLSDINNIIIFKNLFHISLIIKLIAIFYLLFSLFNLGYFKKLRINLSYYKIFLRRSKWMTLNSFYNQIYEYLDKYIIKIFLGPSMFILFTIPQQISSKLTIISNAIIAVILPKLSLNKGNIRQKKIFSANLYFFFYLMGFTLIFFLPFYKTILEWWLKESYNEYFLDIFKIFLLLTFLGSCSNIIISLYEANSLEKKNTILETFTIIPFILGLLLCAYLENLFYFAFILLLKEFILLIIRIIYMKNFILNYKTLILQIILFCLIFICSFLKYFNLSIFSVFLILFVTIYDFKIKILTDEF